MCVCVCVGGGGALGARAPLPHHNLQTKTLSHKILGSCPSKKEDLFLYLYTYCNSNSSSYPWV